jgi:hypothetical protein
MSFYLELLLQAMYFTIDILGLKLALCELPGWGRSVGVFCGNNIETDSKRWNQGEIRGRSIRIGGDYDILNEIDPPNIVSGHTQTWLHQEAFI